MKPQPPKPAQLRCAIYTRKSSEEGLEQGFNSLHAQREACEAYVLSQAGEGWTALATHYDDGGWSGGNMERPGLQQLLADIAAHRIDVVVVYKVDRLTRALADFAKIVEQFDEKGVSFVSVTQAFNTTSSMGRLTLNVLLSFAQFEREVTGERIRDKIAASKAKGMWMGGSLPLGYDAPIEGGDRTLVLNPAEADTVRLIFAKYLELGSVHELRRWLAAEGVLSKRRITKAGRVLGGLPINRGALFYMLKSRVYLGELIHKGVHHPARHTPILEASLFDAVQERLATQAVTHRSRPTRAVVAVLKGKIFDTEGRPMSPSFTHRKVRVHRYYVSSLVQRGEPVGADVIRRVPAQALEDLLLERLQALSRSTQVLTWAVARPRLRRVEIHGSSIQLLVVPEKGAGELEAEMEVVRSRLQSEERVAADEVEPSLMRIVLPVRMQLRGGRTRLTAPSGALPAAKSRIDESLVRALKSAHRLAAEHGLKPTGGDLRNASAPLTKYNRRLCSLAFLAPDIQRAILEGLQPAALKLTSLMAGELPLAWVEQRRAFGFS